MAVSLANDIFTYCIDKGSPVFTCSLDAQGAFDEIPHSILFKKSINNPKVFTGQHNISQKIDILKLIHT